MVRFDVYQMRTQGNVPLVVDIQADLLEALRTRAVVPLLPFADAEPEVDARLKPIVDIVGDPHVLMTTDFRAIPSSALGEKVASVERQRQTIVDAVDFLFQEC